MSSYVGIDLGTTNSAICVYNGEEVILLKSPEQTDVTPSAIYFGPRGNRFVGVRAYNNSVREPERTAREFKRLMGTSTPIELSGAKLSLSPVECSAEILKTLFGYLPENIRNDPDVGTVITVPAAFDQMQKDATFQAASAAGIGKVALMQEPVAAVMSVVRKRKGDGRFLVYDIGGGTLDIAIGESIGGRVSLLSQGGISMCGGRDFDRLLFEHVVVPWLANTFDLPDRFSDRPEYKSLKRMSEFASEQAKIELSARNEAIISVNEQDLATKDISDVDIYIDCPVSRSQLDEVMSDKISESIAAAREALEKAGLSPADIERIVFIGGPSQYRPLRDRVSKELGIAATTEVNPMTAVAEGAAVFAESIDWATQNRGRKSARGSLAAGGPLDLTFNFVARTPDARAKFVLRLGSAVLLGSEFQIDSLETGWSTGRAAIRDNLAIELPLSKQGENAFKIFVFDPEGGPLTLKEDRVVIVRTAATIDAIPASHSIAIEVRDRVGGMTELDFLVKAGDQLPASGQRTYKSGESIRAGGTTSLNFKIYEGDSQFAADNRCIGVFKIGGGDFVDGFIPSGTELKLGFEVTDAGNITFDVTVPSIGANFRSGRNFYSRREAEIDYTNAAKRVQEDAKKVDEHISEIAEHIDDPMLDAAREKLLGATAISANESNPEIAKQAMDNIQEAKILLWKARKANLKTMRRMELEDVVKRFDEYVRQYAKSAESSAFDALAKTAETAIARGNADFETYVRELNSKYFSILMRQDWFILARFKWLMEAPHLFSDSGLHQRLVAEGKAAQQQSDIDALKRVVYELGMNSVSEPDADDILAVANIVRSYGA